MAVFHRFPKERIKSEFTHKGWLLLCPVYVDMDAPDMPSISERNWIPEIWLDIQAYALQTCNLIAYSINPNYEPIDFMLCLEEMET